MADQASDTSVFSLDRLVVHQRSITGGSVGIIAASRLCCCNGTQVLLTPPDINIKTFMINESYMCAVF